MTNDETPDGRIPTEYLEPENRAALLDLLRAQRSARLEVDLAGLRGVKTAVWQLLAAAVRDGVAVSFAGAGDRHVASLDLLGLRHVFDLKAGR